MHTHIQYNTCIVIAYIYICVFGWYNTDIITILKNAIMVDL